jgi:hypothetical protein
MIDRSQPAQALVSRRAMVTGGLVVLGALGAARAKADSRLLLMWPAFIYDDLRHATLSVYVSGNVAKNWMGDEIVRDANQFLDDRLQALSIDSVTYADLLKQVGSAVDLGILVIFCNVHLRSWPIGTDAADLVLGGVTLSFQRAGKTWQNEHEHVGLFASRSDERELSGAILEAVKEHLDQALVKPLTALVK